MSLLHVLVLAAGMLMPSAGQPDKQAPAAAPKAEAPKRVGDPYPFGECPISGGKVATGSDAVVKLYEGREVRFCCASCPETFEKDVAANIAKIDAEIIKDQSALYPLKTSVVTGKDLPEKPIEFVVGNRLVRVGAESEKADVLKDPAKHLAALDKAVIQKQGKDYPGTTCAASGNEFGGDMGEPANVVWAGRLLKLCCKGCQKRLEKDPAKYIAQIDDAWKKSKNAAGEPKGKKSGG